MGFRHVGRSELGAGCLALWSATLSSLDLAASRSLLIGPAQFSSDRAATRYSRGDTSGDTCVSPTSSPLAGQQYGPRYGRSRPIPGDSARNLGYARPPLLSDELSTPSESSAKLHI